MPPDQKELRLGLVAAVLAHIIWGVFPLFWSQLGDFDAIQVVCHRVLWSFVTLSCLAPWLYRNFRRQSSPSAESGEPESRHGVSAGSVAFYLVAAILIAINWLTFVWAVNNDRVLQASLGYYINPLLNVLFGVVLLGERLNRLQWIAISFAAAGVAVMTYAQGGLPWVSLVLASSFASYGLVKKKARLPALLGLWMETLVLFLPALGLLVFAEYQGNGAFRSGDSRLISLLILGGTITIAPLGFFAFAAQRVPLSLLGILQYIGPTMQFLLGIFLFGEAFESSDQAGFVCVWIAVVIFLFSGRSGKKD
ncbi:MAG: EamA family transporter RarD [Planctomycetota bacterium]